MVFEGGEVEGGECMLGERWKGEVRKEGDVAERIFFLGNVD